MTYSMKNSTMETFTDFSPQEFQGFRVMYRLLPIAIAIIVSNGLVFYLFYKRKSLRNSSNYLLLGLAVCDVLTGAVSIPYFIIFSFNVVPPTSYQQFALWMFTLHTFMAVSAAYHILVITAEKYLAILQPLRHHIVTKKTVFKVLAGIWFISALIAVLPLTWFNSKPYLGLIIYSSFCLVFVFLVPYVFMLYAYTMMFKAVSGRKRPSQHRYRQRLQKKNRTDRKCILVFASMAAIYLSCWLPYFTLMLIVNIKMYCRSCDFTTDAVFNKTLDVFSTMRFITSASNPLLYTFFKRDIWRALRGLSERRKSSFEQVFSLRVSSLRYFFVKRQSTSLDSAHSGDASTNISQLSFTARNRPFEVENNEHTNDQYIVYISSV